MEILFFFKFTIDTYFVFLYLKDTSFLERYQSGRTGAVLKTVVGQLTGGSNPSRSDSWRCGRAVIQRIANPSVPKGLGRFNSCRLRYPTTLAGTIFEWDCSSVGLEHHPAEVGVARSNRVSLKKRKTYRIPISFFYFKSTSILQTNDSNRSERSAKKPAARSVFADKAVQ